MRPIESLDPITFTYAGETYKRTAPDMYFKIVDGKEIPITKRSNDLMDALLGGDIVSD
jgi:hypothetical protein